MKVNQPGTSPAQSSDAAAARKTERSAVAAKAHKAKTAAQADETDASFGGSAEISPRGKDFARAREVAAGAPDVREEKIAELKRRIAAGKYKVDADAVADKMVDEHLSMKGM